MMCYFDLFDKSLFCRINFFLETQKCSLAVLKFLIRKTRIFSSSIKKTKIFLQFYYKFKSEYIDCKKLNQLNKMCHV